MRMLFSIGALAALCMAASPSWAQQDADYLAKGKEFFWYQCYVCHVFNDPDEGCPIKQHSQLQRQPKSLGEEPRAILVQNIHGPDLCGVVGSPAGRRTKEGFNHSPAFLAAAPKIVWTEENLDKWLTDTQTFMPGTWMFLHIPDPEKRKMVINFLKTYKAK
jgi:cytochrome c2